MWDNYSTNGAYFDIAEDPNEVSEAASRRQFECEANKFGIWNAKADGELFGFGESADIDKMGGNPEEDELLVELMQNVCECWFHDQHCCHGLLFLVIYNQYSFMLTLSRC